MNIEKQLSVWIEFGKCFETECPSFLQENIKKACESNGWFTPESIRNAIAGNVKNLTCEKLETWLSGYKDKLNSSRESKNIGVVMAGNIPLVGFHDFMCVLIAGHSIQVKLSHDDRYLLPALAKLLCGIEPGFAEKIQFTTERISHFDAVIATGSNNTSRYFEYYFGKYPHLIRKNRNSIAVLTGDESDEELAALADDIFMYFGLGCRSISKIFIPKGYDFSALQKAFAKYLHFIEHSKYGMNYSYYKAIYTMNPLQWNDLGNILLVEGSELSAPPAVLNYSFYTDIQEVAAYIDFMSNQLQCIVCSEKNRGGLRGTIPLGTAQTPNLNDYADNVDTLEFLLNL